MCQPVTEQDWHGGLVKLDTNPFRRAVDVCLLQEPAGGAGIAGRRGPNLNGRQEAEGGNRRFGVTQRGQSHGDLVEVTRPHALVAGGRHIGDHRIAPGIAQ